MFSLGLIDLFSYTSNWYVELLSTSDWTYSRTDEPVSLLDATVWLPFVITSSLPCNSVIPVASFLTTFAFIFNGFSITAWTVSIPSSPCTIS